MAAAGWFAEIGLILVILSPLGAMWMLSALRRPRARWVRVDAWQASLAGMNVHLVDAVWCGQQRTQGRRCAVRRPTAQRDLCRPKRQTAPRRRAGWTFGASTRAAHAKNWVPIALGAGRDAGRVTFGVKRSPACAQSMIQDVLHTRNAAW
jgi:hypothetical protein